jgi:hypothetical protein
LLVEEVPAGPSGPDKFLGRDSDACDMRLLLPFAVLRRLGW